MQRVLRSMGSTQQAISKVSVHNLSGHISNHKLYFSETKCEEMECELNK